MRRIFMIFFILFNFSSANVITDLPKIFKWFEKSPKKPLNYLLKNKKHPKTGVKFNGQGYPIFKKIDTCNMGLSWLDKKLDSFTLNDVSVRQKHFAICSRKLYKKLDRTGLLKVKFTETQKQQLKSGKTPDGYTWHHSENENILELVDRNIHNATAHSGGFSLHHSL